jgi:CheY-like chemotaxis protein
MAKILLVEDDKSLREIYGLRLIAEGYTVISVGDGEEALASAIQERPDLIVSDVMMPKISGFDMLDILRSTPETKDLKVIMMTALSSEDQRARGEALGADRYLVKSQVGIEDVVRTVHEVLGDNVTGAVPAAPVAPAAIAMPDPTPAVQPVLQPMPAPLAAVPIAPLALAPAPAPALAPAPAPQDYAAAPAPLPAPAPIADITPATAPPDLAQLAPQPMPAPLPLPNPVSTLPAPTAPFSSNPPASLGDRIIHPLPSADGLNPTGPLDIAAQMNQELNTPAQGAPIQDILPPAPAAPQQYAEAPQPQAPIPPQPGI